jgi:pimeloyl-ACP methyl ester carboxylesterase
MPTAIANGCEFYYETAGTGTPLVFIHGETHGTSLFEAQMPHFSRGYRCLTYDRRGHRNSAAPLYGYSLWNQIHDLKCLLDHLSIESAVIVAVAMSTTIGASFALQYPERVKALVLCSWYELDGFPLLEDRRKTHQMSFADLHLKMREILLRDGRKALENYIEATISPFFRFSPPTNPRSDASSSSCSHVTAPSTIFRLVSSTLRCPTFAHRCIACSVRCSAFVAPTIPRPTGPSCSRTFPIFDRNGLRAHVGSR